MFENEPYRRADILAYDLLKTNAREHRKNPTEAESVLWQYLRNKQLGAKILRQYIIDMYIVDFFCPSKQLIIEVDGKYHSQSEQQEEDLIREKHLTNYGYKILRFTNEEVLCNTQQTIQTIQQNLQ